MKVQMVYTGINYSTDGTKLVTRSRGNTVKFWDTSTCKLIYTLTGIMGGIDAVYISPLSNTIVTSIYDESWDDGVYLWDGRTGQPLQDTTRVSPGISFVRPSPNGKIIAMVDGHSSWVNLYDISLRQSMHTLIGHVSFPYCGGGTITAVCFSPDGRNVVTASGVDGRAIIWNPSTGERLKTLSGHTSGINSVAFSPDGKTLATSSSDGTILLWDLQ